MPLPSRVQGMKTFATDALLTETKLANKRAFGRGASILCLWRQHSRGRQRTPFETSQVLRVDYEMFQRLTGWNTCSPACGDVWVGYGTLGR